LGFLTPDILAAIANGFQPVGLTATKLLRDTRLPLVWSEPRKMPGFPAQFGALPCATPSLVMGTTPMARDPARMMRLRKTASRSAESARQRRGGPLAHIRPH
jgi:hypothetical protein